MKKRVVHKGLCPLLSSQATAHPRLWASCFPLPSSLFITALGAQLRGFLVPPWPSTHLQLVLMLLVDASKQLGFPPVEGINKGITLSHQAGLKLHTVLLCERAHLSATSCPGALGCQGKPVGNLALITLFTSSQLPRACPSTVG